MVVRDYFCWILFLKLHNLAILIWWDPTPYNNRMWKTLYLEEWYPWGFHTTRIQWMATSVPEEISEQQNHHFTGNRWWLIKLCFLSRSWPCASKRGLYQRGLLTERDRWWYTTTELYLGWSRTLFDSTLGEWSSGRLQQKYGDIRVTLVLPPLFYTLIFTVLFLCVNVCPLKLTGAVRKKNGMLRK